MTPKAHQLNEGHLFDVNDSDEYNYADVNELTLSIDNAVIRNKLASQKNKEHWAKPKILEKEQYAIIPQYALSDFRLTHEALKVLLALSCFANSKGFCYPKRKRIADMTGMKPSNISRATTFLEKTGWLKKEQTPRTCRYWLMVPEVFNDLKPASNDEEDAGFSHS